MTMNVKFTPRAFEDFTYWINNDRKKLKRILVLIKDIQKHPYTGIGKPEQLKYSLQGYYSRRIDAEHRLIYSVSENDIIIIACRYHYE
jgi:toxin YoeB